MKIFYNIVFVSFSVLFWSCQSKKEKEIAQIPIDFETIRFDSLFFTTPTNEISQLRKQYPFFLTANISDAEWADIQQDSLRKVVFAEIQKNIKNFSDERKEIKSLFQHIKYYFPKFQPPKVVTLTSEVDYRSRVIYADSLLLIGIDNYLGENHRFYESLQKYIRAELKKENIIIDIAESFSEKLVPHYQPLTFLDHIVYEGKKLYLMEQLLSKKEAYQLLKYPQEKYEWAEANEAQVWRYFIENQLLYQTDKKLLNRFLSPAPFSKFYLELDTESPAQIGRFVGLKIVQSFAKKHSEKSLTEIMATKPEDLFKQSSYKPEK